MQHASLVGGCEAGAELAGDLDGLVAGKAADPPQERAEVFAVDILHR